MLRWFLELDRILRGEATRPEDLERAEVPIRLTGISWVIVILGVVYGFCMGIFAVARGVENEMLGQTFMQCVASMVKVPLLFLLTLLITFPSLYVFNALVGSKLRLMSLIKLLLASLGVTMALLASLGPIVIFFTVSTPNYGFIVLLNVVVYGVAGILGLAFLAQTLNRLTRQVEKDHTPFVAGDAASAPVGSGGPIVIKDENAEATAVDLPPRSPVEAPPRVDPTVSLGPVERERGVVFGKHVKTVFACWMIVFGLVGSQLGWVLRPFIGSPGQDFQWFRARESNFFEAVMHTLQSLLFG